MRKKEFMFDNCKLCQYGGANITIFGSYYNNLKDFFGVTARRNIADRIIDEIERTVAPDDLEKILTKYEPKARILRSGIEDLTTLTPLARFNRFTMSR